MNIKSLKKFNYFLFVSIIALIVFKLVLSFVFTEVLYKEKAIDGEILLNDSRNIIDGFDVDRNEIISKNSDPQIYIDYESYDILGVKEITFYVNEINKEKEKIEIFTLDDIDDYGAFGSIFTEIKEGENKVIIPDGDGSRGAIRLDLATSENVEIEIDKIVFNEVSSIIDISNTYFLNLVYIFVFILVGILVIKISEKNYKYNIFSYSIGLVLALGSIYLYFKIGNERLKEILILILGFIPICQIMSFFKGILEKVKFKAKEYNILYITFSLYLILNIIFMLYFKVNIHFLIYLAGLYVYGSIKGEVDFYKRKRIFTLLYSILVIVTLYFIGSYFDLNLFNYKNEGFSSYLIISDVLIGFISIIWCDKLKLEKQFEFIEKRKLVNFNKKREKQDGIKDFIIFENIKRLVLTAIFLCVLEVLVHIFIKNFSIVLGVKTAIQFIFSDVFFINLIFIYCIYYFIYALTGKRTSNLIMFFVWAMYIVGNLIKVRYHDTVLQAIDILLIKEIILIGKSYVGAVAYYGIIIAFIVIVFIILKNIKKIILYLKPKANILFSIMMIIPIIFIIMILNENRLKDIDVDFKNVWIDEEVKYEKFGSVLYSYSNLKLLMELYPDAPENYSEEQMKSIKESFAEINVDGKSDIKPDVIVIMAESYFDINEVKDFNISEDIVYPYRKYGNGYIISPRYGGGTAAVEFEALTGFSNMFLLNDVIAYTTYIRNGEDEFPSIVQEFNKTGYQTNIIHPNIANFYNRDKVYKAMRFENYYDIESFEKDGNILNDGYYKDIAFGEKLIEIASDDSRPQFIFGITIEGHSPYEKKYQEGDMTLDISSDVIEDERLGEVKQYCESVKNTSKMIENVIEYVKNTERPTLLYVFGDHLPPIECFNELSFSTDKFLRYSTPFITFSNYKDINLGSDYITPNQIAIQALVDSGINYNKYFDYIYKIREKYPIMKSEFIENKNDEAIEIYKLIQYDLIFGEKYLWEN